MTRNDDYFVCSHCGADVPVGKTFCRECGASDDFGWDEVGRWEDDVDAGYGGEDDFDYNEYLEREFPNSVPRPAKHRIVRTLGVILVVLLCISFVLISILRF